MLVSTTGAAAVGGSTEGDCDGAGGADGGQNRTISSTITLTFWEVAVFSCPVLREAQTPW